MNSGGQSPALRTVTTDQVDTVRTPPLSVLLIGGAGYIGTKLYDELRKDHIVASVDLGWFGVGVFNFFLDYASLTKEFIENFDVVILLAGHSSVQMCKDNIVSAYDNNIKNFIGLVEKIKEVSKHKKIKFIYASSSSVYGDCKDSVATEDNIYYSPANFYDLSKHVIDLTMSVYSGIEYYGLRFGTVNGSSNNFRTDIMINAMVHNAALDGYVKLFNPDVNRPILDINDLVRAVKVIIEKGKKELSGVYNLCSFNSTAKEIAESVSKHLECETVDVICGEVTNPKLQTKVYDFSISNKKFCDTFDFTFTGTIRSIVTDICSHYSLFTGTRNVQKVYSS